MLEIARKHSSKMVDPTSKVLASLAVGAALWPQGVDGPINPEGCRLFADALWKESASSFGRAASPR